MSGEWIEHDGKGMPVGADVLVQVEARDGLSQMTPTQARDVSNLFLWDGDRPAWDIVRYRIVSQAKREA